jgi:hypothetical protein
MANSGLRELALSRCDDERRPCERTAFLICSYNIGSVIAAYDDCRARVEAQRLDDSAPLAAVASIPVAEVSPPLATPGHTSREIAAGGFRYPVLSQSPREEFLPLENAVKLRFQDVLIGFACNCLRA